MGSREGEARDTAGQIVTVNVMPGIGRSKQIPDLARRRHFNPREFLRLRWRAREKRGKRKGARNSTQDDELAGIAANVFGGVGAVRGYEENLYTGGWIRASTCWCKEKSSTVHGRFGAFVGHSP